MQSFAHKYHKGYGTQIDYALWIKFSGVDFQVKTIRVDERNIAIQLWDTAGNEEYLLIFWVQKNFLVNLFGIYL